MFHGLNILYALNAMSMVLKTNKFGICSRLSQLSRIEVENVEFVAYIKL